MVRELRRRKSRPNYAAMITGNDGEDGAGPSTIHEDVDSSGSEFAAEMAPGDIRDAEEEFQANDEQPVLEHQNATIATPAVSPARRAPGKARATKSQPKGKPVQSTKPKPPAVKKQNNSNTTALLKPLGPKIYNLPTPSIQHRHRAVPVYFPVERIERLEAPPPLFGPVKTVPANNFTFNSVVTDRLGKAWGNNVGPGPLWDLMEDRSAFKEAIHADGELRTEANKRPIVYPNVRVIDGWEVLDHEKATPYLPTDTVTTEDGNLQPPAPVYCFLGPFGQQSRVESKVFDTHDMSAFFPEKRSHVFNAGGPVWGLDWCPTHPDVRPGRGYKQYLAVAPFPSRSHAPNIGAKMPRPAFACVQIWALRPTPTDDGEATDDDTGEVKCEMVLCLEGGPAQEIKWCPLPSHDIVTDNEQNGPRPRKLGILAGTFEDGSLSIYAVPDPEDIKPEDRDYSLPIFVRLPEPLLRIELEEDASCWTLDWANSEIIAVGTTNGNLAVYNIRQALDNGDGPNIFPTYFMPVHQSAFRALAWIRVPPVSGSGTTITGEDPTVIASGGYDGVECLTDIREPQGFVVNRTRDVINSVTYSPYGGGPIMIDHDNSVKVYAISPGMLGRGHVLAEPDGTVWSVNGSDYHPQLAVGSADGTCVTTNTLRTTRRGAVPFFVHKIYQLDYSRKTGEYRMLEQFLPQESRDSQKIANAKGKEKEKAQPRKDDDGSANNPMSTGVWPPEVGIHRVAWNSGNGLAGAPWLASGTASGLCRVDRLLGRWVKDRIPYISVESIRQDTGMVEDDSDVE